MDILEMMLVEEMSKEDKIKKFVKLVTNSDNPYDPILHMQYAASVGFNLHELTEAELKDIEMQINELL